MENNENFDYLKNIKVQTLAGEEVTSLDLNPAVFGKEYFPDIINRVINWQLLKRMSGTHKAKGISDISGTTKKPHRQKGTGSARQGSLRSPQFRGGAVIFGPVVRSHGVKLPKRLRRLGLSIALSAKFINKKLIILDKLELNSCKTKDFVDQFKQYTTTSALFVDNNICENLKKSVSNIHGIDVIPEIGLNVYDIVKHEYLFVTQDAIKKLEERLCR